MSSDLFPFDSDPLIVSNPQPGGMAALIIMRRDIEKADLKPLLALLEPLMKSREMLLKRAGTLTTVVDGYNDDPRDIVDIPEVRKYFETLERNWPYLPFFLERAEGEYLLYFALCYDGRRLKDDGRLKPGTSFKDPHRFGDAAKRFFSEICRAFLEAGYPPGEEEFNCLDATANEIQKMFKNSGPMLKGV